MAFASVLNAYCTMLGCSNKELAERCGISMSALSRYRNGKRTPRANSETIDQLASGISSIALDRGVASASSKQAVAESLKDGLTSSKPLGPSFSARINSLMKLLGIKNADLAAELQMDSSYISRIRRGERAPNDKKRFADVASQLASGRCMENGMIADVLTLAGAAETISDWEPLNIDSAAGLAHIIRRWLLGNQVIEADISNLDALFAKLDDFYFEGIFEESQGAEPLLSCPAKTEPSARFFSGREFIWRAEMAFLENAASCGAEHLYMSTDMPALETELSASELDTYRKCLMELIGRGCEITVIHSADRPLRDSLSAMEQWLPLYMTGKVTPLYMEGAGNRLFCHVNNVCECCALASEAVRGHESDGRYYLTSLPEDLEYYQKKMKFIIEKASVLFEIYSDDDPAAMEKFEREEAQRKAKCEAREIRAGQYKNLQIILYTGDCAVVTIGCKPCYRFVIRHPKVRYVLSQMT